MEKTAMQTLIEKYKALPKSESAWTNKLIQSFIQDAEHGLELERCQIIDAHVDGQTSIKAIPNAAFGNQYYTTKYQPR